MCVHVLSLSLEGDLGPVHDVDQSCLFSVELSVLVMLPDRCNEVLKVLFILLRDFDARLENGL